MIAEDGTANVETLWARPLGDDRYRLDNSPFFAYSLSWNDVVFAPFDPDRQFPTFQKVVEKSGHRTIRVIFDPPAEAGSASEQLLKQIVELGCSWEGANKSYICVDVPPEVSLQEIRQFMIDNGLQFEHADPTYDELFPGKSGDRP